MEEYDGYDSGALVEVDAFSNVAQGLAEPNKSAMIQYWQRTIDNIERIGESGNVTEVFKSTALPLARIKKVMKTDSEVLMISAEAPILFAKGCDIFITELTMRAWIHAEESKRRTLQRSDIASALQKSDMFDFLIDIVPREEAHARRYHGGPPVSAGVVVEGPPTAGRCTDEQQHQLDMPGSSLPPGMAALGGVNRSLVSTPTTVPGAVSKPMGPHTQMIGDRLTSIPQSPIPTVNPLSFQEQHAPASSLEPVKNDGPVNSDEQPASNDEALARPGIDYGPVKPDGAPFEEIFRYMPYTDEVNTAFSSHNRDGFSELQ